MNLKSIADIQPVAVALEDVQGVHDLRFNGIDLETGNRISILIERDIRDHAIATDRQFSATGLVLLLSIKRLADLV
ncbi:MULTISPECIES: hypothetical protein [unclassified Caulobacter]|uniref:hypothetical protein n=1 Tax=unclassified Caulobacter TaxID=2648921 RepID=UPI000D35084A|nr:MULTISPECIES: hypothetical protein [unclassified Caulobacter]PTS89116.1 hypothetical protein DBR21_07555 [Caulobacter sp. HMWF009]PTT05712.1 hypothetical protein DBR10_14905 [Caulobacter sp. HMWF025]